MQTLRNTLNGQRREALSPTEIRRVVQEAAEEKSVVKQARLHLYVVAGLSRKVISPDLLLPIAISSVKGTRDLTMVAFALRFGANRNLYITVPKSGTAHVIVYTVITLREAGRDVTTIRSVITVLLLMGSSLASSAFDQSVKPDLGVTPPRPSIDRGFVSEISSTLLGTKVSECPGGECEPLRAPGEFTPIESVKDWLARQGYAPFKSSSAELIAEMKPETRIVLGTVTDRPDIAFISEDVPYQSETSLPKPVTVSSVFPVPPLENVLNARAKQIIAQYPVLRDSRVMQQEHGEYVGLVLSIETASSDAFTHFVDAGLTVTYFTMNRLVLELRSAVRAGDTTIVGEISSMLQYAISKGAQLDYEQLTVISTTNGSLAQQFLLTYRTPRWKKFCAGPDLSERKSPQEVPDSLRVLAFNLELDPDLPKSKLCAELLALSEADASALKKAAVLRQKARVGAAVSTIADFVPGNVPAATCSNKTFLQTDPLEYNDATMSFYRDTQGSVWCFTSPMYESLLSNPINPHTSQPLPASFQAQIRSHLDILKRLGIAPSNPTSVLTAIDSLSKPDEVSNAESLYILDTLLQAARVAGIDEARIRRLTPTQMNIALATIDMDRPEITEVNMPIEGVQVAVGAPVLTPDHALITFARAAYYAIKDQPALAKVFFNSIQLQVL